MDKAGVFIAAFAATAALASATGCFYCASEGCSEKKEVCFWASPAPVYKCEKYTTSCGDKECEWDEKCISAKSCGYGHCKRVHKCVKFYAPKKCEEVQICKKYGYDQLVCKVKKECKDFEPIKCGDEFCGKGYECKKEEFKKAYVCDYVCGSKTACSCSSGQVCRYSYGCGVKSVHPSFKVFYYPGTSGKYGDGGYYRQPTLSPSRESRTKLIQEGDSLDRSSGDRGQIEGLVSDGALFATSGGQVGIASGTVSTDISSEFQGEVDTGFIDGAFDGDSGVQAVDNTLPSSFASSDLGDFSTGVGLVESRASYGSLESSQDLDLDDGSGDDTIRGKSGAKKIWVY